MISSFLTFNNILLILAIFIGSVVLFVLLYLYLKQRNGDTQKFNDLYNRIKEDIKFAVAPKFMELSIGVTEFVDLAIEIWRMEQRIIKSASNLPENQLKGLENSIQKMRRYLEKYDIEIVDYKNQKYNEGLNLDILSVEKDLTLIESMIKETVEPTIICKGQVVRKAKIILISNH